MKNKYEIRGKETAIFLNTRKLGQQETLISTNKLSRAMEFPNKWYANKGYAVGKIKENGKVKLISFHRWILDAPPDKEVDHFDHDTLNNTDSNLRLVSEGENQQNRISAQKNSKSGIRGVSWDARSRKWKAKIQLNKKAFHVGLFNTIYEAESAVIEARMHHMPFSQEASL